jgi:molybdopterin synthase catalytic subunit
VERVVRIVEGPIPTPDDGDRPAIPEIGAIVHFEGRVRGLEGARAIAGIEYTAYRPMAERELARILDEIAARFRVERVVVEHAVGRIRVGEVALVVKVYSGHRAEAFRACEYLIVRLKETVPIWKDGFGED